MLFWSLVPGNRTQYHPDSKQRAQWNRGAHLVQGGGHCGACHAPRGPAYNELNCSEKWPLGSRAASSDAGPSTTSSRFCARGTAGEPSRSARWRQ
ncbi:protein of unknown function [Paraburkholderia kururiensis]